MSDIIITSFFTTNGAPATGLTPVIRVWELTGGDQTLVIGSTQGTHDPGLPGGVGQPGSGVGTDGVMVSVYDNSDQADGSGGTYGGSDDGFYKFVFNGENGYDPLKCYVFQADGGAGQPPGERYQVGEINTTSNAEALIDAFYDEPRIEHNVAGSIGEHINQSRANLTQMALDVTDVEQLVRLLLKFETGRTKIDGINSTLVVYDDDCITPLRTFQLRNSSGQPSTEEVCERIPLSSGTSDGLNTCE